MQLLHNLSIRGVRGSEKLLRVIRNPVTDHFPTNTIKLSESATWILVMSRLSAYEQPYPPTPQPFAYQSLSKACRKLTR